MFSDIVVGTDGSETAGAALGAAIDLARTHGATLHVVSAYKPAAASTAMMAAGATVAGDDGVRQALAQDATEKVLNDAVRQAEGIEVTTHTAGGPPADVLVAVAEDVGADLIVVGSKGMQRRVLGSVPNTVSHRAPCNVLIVKTT
ncbi:MAG TPA: universal stress protein [Acidimicrobiales bacterium]|nr:universal stress protein [Acidimicrobiales bacterium]